MKDLRLREKKEKLRLVSVLLPLLVMALMVIFTTTAYAAPDKIVDSLSNTRSTILQNEKLLLNPFTLQREFQSFAKREVDIRRISARPRIRLPLRPSVRSIFKPDIPLCN